MNKGYIFSYFSQGLDITDKGLDLISNLIRKSLDIDCAVLMGANIASEVANENFCEATIGMIMDIIINCTLRSDTSPSNPSA